MGVDWLSGAVGFGAGALAGRFLLPSSEPFDVPIAVSVEQKFPVVELLAMLSAAGIEYRTATYEIPVDVRNAQLTPLSFVQVQASKADAARAIVLQLLQRMGAAPKRELQGVRAR
jgi:hypothetical protein